MDITALDVLSVGEDLAPENEAVVGQNNTAVNKFYNSPGVPYCGLFIRYCMEMVGCHLLAGCSNPAYVPTLRAYMDAQGWQVPISAARAGDIVIEGDDDHVFYIYRVLSGGAIIALEGNGQHVKATPAEAEAGTGATFEGIGYSRRVLGSHKVYHPPYEEGGTAPAPVDAAAIIEQLQGMLGVAQDGEIGPDTRSAAATMMLTALLGMHPLKIGANGVLVYILQGLLYACGYDPRGYDGQYGRDTAAAVTQLQADHGLLQDGEAGKDTFTVLLDL